MPPPKTAPPAAWRGMPAWGALFIVATIALAGLIVLHVIDSGRQSYQIRAETDSRNLATILRDDIGGTLDGIDILLRSAVYEIERRDSNPAALEAYLAHQQSLAPPTISLRVADAAGIVRFGPGVRGNAQIDLSDRPFFALHRDGPGEGVIVGTPLLARLSERWVMPVSRRISKPDGSFGGIVYANVPLDFLTTKFASIETGRHGSVALFDSNRQVVARHPENEGPGSTVGVKMVSPQIVALMDEGRREGTYQAPSSADNIFRTYSYEQLAGYPLFVMVGLAEDDFLADWRAQRASALALYGAFSAVVLAISAMLFRAWLEGSRTLAALSEAQGKATRTMAALGEFAAENRAVAARLRLVLETAAEGIVGVDGEGRVTFANSAAASILGHDSAAAMQGMPSAAALGHLLADGKPCIDSTCPICRTIADGQTRRVADERFTTTAGEVVPVEYVVAPMTNEETVAGAVLIFHDIGARLAIEADLQRSNTELEQFAYVTSHDLRQPLRTIGSYLGLIERRLGPAMTDELREFLDYAIGGAKRLDGLIVNLLEYSRIGRHPDAMEAVPLGPAVADSLINLEVAIREAGATVTVGDGLPTIVGCRMELTRLFQNLVGNAVKYRAADCPPEIEIGCRDKGRNWVLWVKDNGIGIAPEDQERAFAIFQRLAGSERCEGAGIGLAVCRKIVERHHGRLWVESAVGKGSTFFMAIPKTT